MMYKNVVRSDKKQKMIDSKKIKVFILSKLIKLLLAMIIMIKNRKLK